jgi:ribosome recycling factor
MTTGKEVLLSFEEKMKKAIEVFNDEIKTIRTGRANPEVFKRVRVECYGSNLSLSEVAGITAPDGRSFMIQPFDKTNLKAVEQAIVNSDLGFNPSNDGQVIRIIIPALSEDRRKDLVKQVNKIAEDKGRLPVRNLRRDANDQIKKLKGTVSEDELKRFHDDLEKVTTKYIAQVDELAQKKEKELQTI